MMQLKAQPLHSSVTDMMKIIIISLRFPPNPGQLVV